VHTSSWAKHGNARRQPLALLIGDDRAYFQLGETRVTPVARCNSPAPVVY